MIFKKRRKSRRYFDAFDILKVLVEIELNRELKSTELWDDVYNELEIKRDSELTRP